MAVHPDALLVGPFSVRFVRPDDIPLEAKVMLQGITEVRRQFLDMAQVAAMSDLEFIRWTKDRWAHSCDGCGHRHTIKNKLDHRELIRRTVEYAGPTPERTTLILEPLEDADVECDDYHPPAPAPGAA